MKFSLVHKLVLGILAVSVTTYATSAFFVFYLKPYIAPMMTDWIYISGIFALGVLWTVLLGWAASRYIIKPLVRLTSAVDTIAEGSLSIQIPEHRSKDEIGQLHQSFQVMLGNLRQMIVEVSNNASTTDQNADRLRITINQAANQVETIALTIDNIAEGASAQTSSAKLMLQTAEQTASTAQDMNVEAGHALKLSTAMVDIVEDSSGKLHSLVDGMAQISESSETTLQIVQDLEKHANEISQISQLVSEIADQTHLLALNASIEAAHAGEHGQGFDVVAQHIRKLAADSAAAGEQINQIVRQMQEQTLMVVSKTHTQVQMIRSETSIGEDTKHVLSQMTSSVHDAVGALHNIVNQISTQTSYINSTHEQAKEMAHIAASISDGTLRISSAAQEQTAVMQEIAASSDMLRDNANSLKQKTVAFKL